MITNNSIKKVAFFLGFGWLGVSTPPLTCAQYLAQNGIQVDIYTNFSSYCDSMDICRPKIEHKNISFFYDDVLSEDRSEVCIYGKFKVPENFKNLVRLARQYKQKYDWCVGFDPVGLVYAAAYAWSAKIPYLYHSLEIEEKNSPLKDLEILCQKGALLTISQDKARCEVLAYLNKGDINKIAPLPNSSIGSVLPERDDFFRSKFPQIGSRQIVMGCGTLLPECGISDFLIAARSWPDDYALVLHGWIPNPQYKEAVEQEILKRKNVFLSTDILPVEEKFRIFRSADVCMAFFYPKDTNYTFAAGSAGKIYDAMRCGTPIIGNDIPGMKELLSDNGCGVVVPGAGQIAKFLDVIFRNYETFRNNCLSVFPRYEFSAAYKDLLQAYSLD